MREVFSGFSFFIIFVAMFNYLSILAGIMYIAFGAEVLIYKFFAIKLDDMEAYPLGGLMVLYGFFRIARAIYRIKKSREDGF
ncbi:hypothetical protein SAMN05421544_11730 [Riemerella columbipharyngis]|uniref:C4-dicarboxylate ABC transporter n=2 Tax=Riemerella columbipharyngis TaxID=1071918 RepID=A0A1G7ETQ6_9FLAO|nr:hypothetical protein SAMN05421544_11730 [Riemerella columbipharyngis]